MIAKEAKKAKKFKVRNMNPRCIDEVSVWLLSCLMLMVI